MAAVNGSFASPAANADYKLPVSGTLAGVLSNLYNGISGWAAVLTVLLVLVAYDQCRDNRPPTRKMLC